ncbi:MAG: hypothetical protein BTN85_0732 [Candidatus Methanohalarchaeum thermophilum]|uniref:Uncharacterized protein n=1 Tax=Methanohalarchaeum thermophilum TaxID=1903181 RepID=A0A1Q6DV63_METT1|nr:MAG: hypothetical protein BTN85_0732 [Candidatus Methanohalarchaeum thermophilum]
MIRSPLFHERKASKEGVDRLVLCSSNNEQDLDRFDMESLFESGGSLALLRIFKLDVNLAEIKQ